MFLVVYLELLLFIHSRLAGEENCVHLSFILKYIAVYFFPPCTVLFLKCLISLVPLLFRLEVSSRVNES